MGTVTPTSAPTNMPTPPSFQPTKTPSVIPTSAPTKSPTAMPTRAPTKMPTATPTRAECASVSIDGLPMWPLEICFKTNSLTTALFYCEEGTLMQRVWDSEDCSGAAQTIDLAESDYDANCDATENCAFATMKHYD